MKILSFFAKPRILVITLTVVVTAFFITYFFNRYLYRSKASGTETMNLSFNPTAVSAAAGQSFPAITIKAKPSVTMFIRGYEMIINFDKTMVELAENGIDYGNVLSVSIGVGDDNSKRDEINSRGWIKLIGQSNLPDMGTSLSSNSDTIIATLTFKAKTADATSISIPVATAIFQKTKTDYSLESIYSTADLTLPVNGPTATNTPTPTLTPTITPGATSTPTPTPTITPTPSPTIPVQGNAVLNMQIKMQGIGGTNVANHCKILPVKIVLKKTGEVTAISSSTINFTVGNNGIWSGSLATNLTTGTNYYLLIKPPFSIQKKICKNNPAETTAGLYQCSIGEISLTAGTAAAPTANNLNLTGVTVLAGDLPITNGNQNSVADAVDFAYLIVNIGRNDADIVSKADLNCNGGVDMTDFGLIKYTLSVAPDEE